MLPTVGPDNLAWAPPKGHLAVATAMSALDLVLEHLVAEGLSSTAAMLQAEYIKKHKVPLATPPKPKGGPRHACNVVQGRACWRRVFPSDCVHLQMFVLVPFPQAPVACRSCW